MKKTHVELIANNSSTEDTKVTDWYSYTMHYDSSPTYSDHCITVAQSSPLQAIPQVQFRATTINRILYTG